MTRLLHTRPMDLVFGDDCESLDSDHPCDHVWIKEPIEAVNGKLTHQTLCALCGEEPDLE